MNGRNLKIGLFFASLALATPAFAAVERCDPHWTIAWAAAQMIAEPAKLLPAIIADDVTVRETVRPSVDGGTIRVRFSNAFGRSPMTIAGATIARAVRSGSSAVVPATMRPLLFMGRRDVVIPPGADYLSDPVAFSTKAQQPVAISVHIANAADPLTGHPGSRTTSFVARGNRTDAADLPDATRVDQWLTVAGIEALGCGRGAVVALGDSITDGRGSTTNGDDRWTDVLAARLQADPATRGIAAINEGIGGNRVLLDGLGPSAVSRIDRDVLSLPDVRWLIVFEGINDLGTLTLDKPVSAEVHHHLVEQIICAYAQIVARAHARGLRVIGATLLPMMANAYYHPDAATEADRQAINRWIREVGRFDAVVDVDRLLRDPARPAFLNLRFDSGDGLHPNPEGYRVIGEAFAAGLSAEIASRAAPPPRAHR